MEMKVRNKRQGGLLGMYLIMALFAMTACTACGCAFVNVSLFQPALPLEEKVIEGEGPGKVLVIDVSGVLSYEEQRRASAFKEEINLVARVKEELEKASEDDEIKALILRIQSPGGTVNASDLLYYEIMQFKKERHVKVVACFLGIATSGGYYVATAADRIFAQPTTLTGSIGTIAIKFNVQGLMEKIGVEEETVKSGGKKDIWSPFRPSTEEEKKILQSIIDEYQDKFLQVVQSGRRSITEADLALVKDGRIFSGPQALKVHLVDQLGYLQDAVQWARSSIGMKQAKVVVYHRPGTYVNNIYSLSKAGESSWAEQLDRGELLHRRQAWRFMYLWLP